MSKSIDIEIVVDTVTLLASYPSPSTDPAHPTGIQHNGFAYMIAQAAYVQSGQATGDLAVNALVNDTIRWRSLSLSGNTDNSAVLYDIRWFKGEHVTTEPTQAIISQPYVPLPILVKGQQTNPPTFSAVLANDYFNQVNVCGHGTENYMVFFYLTIQDPKTGKPVLKGYYYWDPAIIVP